HALLEVPEAGDAQELHSRSGVQVTWLPREGRPHGELLDAAVRRLMSENDAQAFRDAAADGPASAAGDLEDVDVDETMLWETTTGHGAFYAWLAGEAAVIKALRRHLVSELGLDRKQVSFMGYWRQGRPEGWGRDARGCGRARPHPPRGISSRLLAVVAVALAVRVGGIGLGGLGRRVPALLLLDVRGIGGDGFALDVDHVARGGDEGVRIVLGGERAQVVLAGRLALSGLGIGDEELLQSRLEVREVLRDDVRGAREREGALELVDGRRHRDQPVGLARVQEVRHHG